MDSRFRRKVAGGDLYVRGWCGFGDVKGASRGENDQFAVRRAQGGRFKPSNSKNMRYSRISSKILSKVKNTVQIM
jgi:hypothetical protein